MSIQPTYVTFEQAKWLKEIGFDEPTTVWRQHGDGISGDVEGKRDYYNRKGKVYTSLPEQWQVIEWLRVNHSLFIIVTPSLGWYFTYSIIDVQLDPEQHIERQPYSELGSCDYDTPQEAYSSAFDHIRGNGFIEK